MVLFPRVTRKMKSMSWTHLLVLALLHFVVPHCLTRVYEANALDTEGKAHLWAKDVCLEQSAEKPKGYANQTRKVRERTGYSRMTSSSTSPDSDGSENEDMPRVNGMVFFRFPYVYGRCAPLEKSAWFSWRQWISPIRGVCNFVVSQRQLILIFLYKTDQLQTTISVWKTK